MEPYSLQYSHLGRTLFSESGTIDDDVSDAVQSQTSFGAPEQADGPDQRYRIVVAIPAQNEAERILSCLATSLRDSHG